MDKVMLFNCLDEEVLVQTSTGRIMQLPRAPQPIFVDAPNKPEDFTFSIPTLGKESVIKGKHTGSMVFYHTSKEIGVMGEPDRMPGVWFLVEERDFIQFPDREDFVCVATWALVPKKTVKRNMKKKHWKKYRRDVENSPQKNDILIGKWMSVLAGVTRSPYSVKTDDSPVLDA